MSDQTLLTVYALWVLAGVGCFTFDEVAGRASFRRPPLWRRAVKLLLCVLLGPLTAVVVGAIVLVLFPLAYVGGMICRGLFRSPQPLPFAIPLDPRPEDTIDWALDWPDEDPVTRRP